MTELIPPDEIEAAFEAKADTLMEKKEALDVVLDAECNKLKAEIEISKHDSIMKETQPEKVIINGKNETERKLQLQTALATHEKAIYEAKCIHRMKELDDQLSDLEIKKIDMKLRSMGA